MPTLPDDPSRPRDGADDDRIALIEERAVIGKRALDRGGVRVTTRTETHRETLRVPLEDVSVEVERVPVGRYVEAAEDPREEGDVTILPVYEERLVVEKKLFLVEEVRVRRVRRVRDEEIPVELRRQVAEVERLPADPAADPLPAGSPGGTAHPE